MSGPAVPGKRRRSSQRSSSRSTESRYSTAVSMRGLHVGVLPSTALAHTGLTRSVVGGDYSSHNHPKKFGHVITKSWFVAVHSTNDLSFPFF